MSKIEEIIKVSASLHDEVDRSAFIGIATEFVATLDDDSVLKVLDIETKRKKYNWKSGSLFFKCKDAGVEDCLASMQEIGLALPECDFFSGDIEKNTIKPELQIKKSEYKIIYGSPEEISFQVTEILEMEGWRIWGPPLPYGSYLAQSVVREVKVFAWKGIDYPYENHFKELYDKLSDISENEISWELERHLKPLRIQNPLLTSVAVQVRLPVPFLCKNINRPSSRFFCV